MGSLDLSSWPDQHCCFACEGILIIPLPHWIYLYELCVQLFQLAFAFSRASSFITSSSCKTYYSMLVMLHLFRLLDLCCGRSSNQGPKVLRERRFRSHRWLLTKEQCDLNVMMQT